MSLDYQNYFKHYVHHIGRSNNMGLVRYLLAFGVLIAHFNYVFASEVPWFISSYFSVGGFFALSGFVLFNSLIKGNDIKSYIINRLWRILPSYFFIVIVSAASLSLISNLGINEYFSSPDFWKYVFANLSFANFLHPSLPGVFDGNAVNGSLWTMKIELQLTFFAPLIVWAITRYKLNIIKSISIIIAISIVYRYIFNILYENTYNSIYEILGRQFVGQFIFFSSGILLYLIYNRIKNHFGSLFILSLSAYILFKFIFNFRFSYLVLIPIIISILCVSASLLPVRNHKVFEKNNISYELYLCHMPVIQLIYYFNTIYNFGIETALMLSITGTFALSSICYFTVGNLYLKRKKSRRFSPSPPSLVK